MKRRRKVLVVQEVVPFYRKALFDGVGDEVELTLVHCQSEVRLENVSEIILKKSTFMGIIWLSGLLSFVRKGEYETIILPFDVHFLQVLILTFTRRRTRIVLWGHRYSKFGFINILRILMAKRADGLLLYNDEELTKLLNDGIEENKIFIAENTISVANSSNKSRCKKDSFIYVGRAQKRKRVDILLKEFSRVKGHLPENTKIRIVGDGKENDELRSLCDKLKILESVEFLGKIEDPEELVKLFEKAYAYVSPYAIGLGAQHSFSYGVPVVTSKLGYVGAEYHNLVHLKNSVIFSKHEELGNALVSLSNNLEFTSELGNSAFRYYKDKLSMQKMIKGFLESVYQ